MYQLNGCSVGLPQARVCLLHVKTTALSCGQYTGMQASKGSQLRQAPRLDTTWFIRSAIYMQHANMYRAKPMQLRR